jgi:hypothetical protein
MILFKPGGAKGKRVERVVEKGEPRVKKKKDNKIQRRTTSNPLEQTTKIM